EAWVLENEAEKDVYVHCMIKDPFGYEYYWHTTQTKSVCIQWDAIVEYGKYAFFTQLESNYNYRKEPRYVDKVTRIDGEFKFKIEKNATKIVDKIITTDFGIAINPATPADEIIPWIEGYPFIKHVIVMSVVAGKSGQKFIPEVLEKVKQLKEFNPNLVVYVDGGINKENLELVKNSGADVAIIGTAIYNGEIC
ncbi:MAG: hypothetical protein FWD32_03090, partial [Firmicutes bacterium]|nr:hypothetical protein [Bacillota bacterium]